MRVLHFDTKEKKWKCYIKNMHKRKEKDYPRAVWWNNKNKVIKGFSEVTGYIKNRSGGVLGTKYYRTDAGEVEMKPEITPTYNFLR